MRATGSVTAAHDGEVEIGRGTTPSSRPRARLRPTSSRITRSGAVTHHADPSSVTATGPSTTRSNVYVAATYSATSPDGASSSRSPSGWASITSANLPHGDSSQRPTTTRTPLVVPTPAIRPVNRSGGTV